MRRDPAGRYHSVVCGVHVHVAMPDPETAVTAFDGMRKWVPVLQAIGADSPLPDRCARRAGRPGAG
jgi:glutamate---cysteine ligase / carboxylate-amine ligase